MNGIQGVGSMQSIAQMFLQDSNAGAASTVQSSVGGALSSGLSSIQNDDGQSLLDIRDQMKAAVQDAIQNHDGTGDVRSTVRSAIEGTLEENGFDLDEVRSAMQDHAGGSPLSAIYGGGQPMLEMMQRFSGGEGFDPSSLASTESSELSDSMIQSFLEQFRAGINLDFEV